MVGQIVTEIFRRSHEQSDAVHWIGGGRGLANGEAHWRDRTCLSPSPLQTTNEEDRPRRQDFGEPAVGCRAGDFAMQCFFLSNRIFSCFTEKGIVRTESDDRYEKHFGNCKTLFKCKVLFLLPSVGFPV